MGMAAFGAFLRYIRLQPMYKRTVKVEGQRRGVSLGHAVSMASTN